MDQVPPEYKGDAGKGRVLFSTRGCLACHSHQATEISQKKSDNGTLRTGHEVGSEFRPQSEQDRRKARCPRPKRQGIGPQMAHPMDLNPSMHSPRTRMPITHLTNKEAADVAACGYWPKLQERRRSGSEDMGRLESRRAGTATICKSSRKSISFAYYPAATWRRSLKTASCPARRSPICPPKKKNWSRITRRTWTAA